MRELSFAVIPYDDKHHSAVANVYSLAEPPQTGEDPHLRHLLLGELIVEPNCDLFGEFIVPSRKYELSIA